MTKEFALNHDKTLQIVSSEFLKVPCEKRLFERCRKQRIFFFFFFFFFCTKWCLNGQGWLRDDFWWDWGGGSRLLNFHTSLRVRTDRFEQTVQTQITTRRLIWVYTVCHTSSDFTPIHRYM